MFNFSLDITQITILSFVHTCAYSGSIPLWKNKKLIKDVISSRRSYFFHQEKIVRKYRPRIIHETTLSDGNKGDERKITEVENDA